MRTAVIVLSLVGLALLAGEGALAVRSARLSRRAEEAGDRARRLEGERAAGLAERSRLEGALAAAGLGVLITDPSGAVVFSNPAAAPYLSGRPGEAVVESRLGEAIRAVLAGGGPLTRELELYAPRRRVVRLQVVPLQGEAGERLGAVALVADVTEERRVEAMRRDFVANVGHELKTPLGALTLLTETLAAHPEDPETVARLAERVRAEAIRLSRLVDDMLDLSQVEAASAPPAPVPLAEVVARVAEEAAPEAARRGVRLIVEEVPAGAVVSGDERQLRTMLGNLVDNALKYSDPSEGRPAPRVWVRTLVEDDAVVLEVQDEGIGIPEAHHDRIFERFYRVDRARSRETGGTGLGLSIVRQVALHHGGEVGLESRVGEGTTFRVRLPRWGAA